MPDNRHRNQPPPCGTCGGSGKVYRSEYNPKTKRTEQKLVPCPSCNGRGR